MNRRIDFLLEVACLGACLGIAVGFPLTVFLAAAGALNASSTLLTPQAEHAPGYRNPEVTQRTLGSTVCVKGWSATVRPPVSYTSYLKRSELRYLGLPGTVSDYQLDHLLSLSLGGSPYDTRNLWLQPESQAKRDDKLENRWHADLCAGRLTLRQVQAAELSYKRGNG